MLEISPEKAKELLTKYFGNLLVVGTLQETQNKEMSIHNAIEALKSIRDNSSFHLQELGERFRQVSQSSENPHLYLKTFIVQDHEDIKKFNEFMTELKGLREIETVNFNPTSKISPENAACLERMTSDDDHIKNPSLVPSLFYEELHEKYVGSRYEKEPETKTCSLQ